MNTNLAGSLDALSRVLEKLTGPDGCPWDKEQTPATLADYIIEESHELAAAIRSDDPAEIRGELGDLFFLLMFVSSYFEKKETFSMADALDEAAAKMIRRHPHVFGNASFASLDEQLKTWEKIKKEEKAQTGATGGLFASLPSSLPPLIKAYRIHSKAARAGFTWPSDEEVEQQVESEWLELLDAIQDDKKDAENHELGDILFSLVELGRRKGIKASAALDEACIRFLKRYARMEEYARKTGVELSSLDLDAQDGFWNMAKQAEVKDIDSQA